MRFLVKAHRDRDGVTVLAFEAANALDARQQAERQGYTVLSTRAARFSTPHLALARRFSVPLFCEELLALLDAGLGLVEAIALLAHKARTPDGMRILGELKRVLDEGRSFSTALDSVPGAFPPVLVASVRASERTGNPPEALRRFLAYHRQISGLRDKILAASVYPVVLMMVGALVVVFLLAYVIPRFSRVYEDVGEANLPVLSRWLMYWGQLVAEHTGLLGVGVAGILAGAVWAASRPRLRAAIERRLWRLPSLGEYLRVYQLARFTRTVAMLLKGGIPDRTRVVQQGRLLRSGRKRSGMVQGMDQGRAGHRIRQYRRLKD